MKALLRKLFEGGIQLSGFKQPGRGKMQLEFISYFLKMFLNASTQTVTMCPSR